MKWTACLAYKTEGGCLRYAVRDAGGRYLAFLEVEDTEEGRRNVARMVAALQMEEVLDLVRDHFQSGNGECALHPETRRAVVDALAAAKEMPK